MIVNSASDALSASIGNRIDLQNCDGLTRKDFSYANKATLATFFPHPV